MTDPTENKNPNGLPSVQERALECADKIQRIALENPSGFADKHFLAIWFAAILDHESRCATAASGDVEKLTREIKAKVNDPVIQLGIGIAIEELSERGLLSSAGKVVNLSDEAYETLQGMAEFCINHGYCMGMDEGLNEKDEYHPFVKELIDLSQRGLLREGD